MKKIISVLILVFILLLTGCSVSKTGAQTKAIEEALNQLVENHEVFCYFKCEDIKGQIKKQEKTQKEKEKAVYTIVAEVPDLSEVPFEQLESDFSSSDIYSGTTFGFEKEYKEITNKGLKEIVLKDENIKWKEEKIRFHLTKGKKGWVATVEKKDGEMLADAARREIWSASDRYMKMDKEYHKVYVESEVRSQLEEVFSEMQYRISTDIEEITQKDDDVFHIKLTYYNPEEVYKGILDNFYDEYAKEGRNGYKVITEKEFTSYNQENFEKYFKEWRKEKQANKKDEDRESAELTVILDKELKIEITEGMEELQKAVLDKKKSMVGQTLAKINEEFVIHEQERPATSVLSGANTGVSILVKSSPDVSDKHIDFQNEGGASVLKAFIRSGEELTIYIPAGNYRMIQGWGDHWYGNDISYGPEGNYKTSSQILNVVGGNSYTLTLYGVSDGNMPTKGIEYPY